MTEKDGVRGVWGGLQDGRCPVCGNYFARIPARVDGQDHRRLLDFLKTCQNCRK
jgi:hypothetical protein